MTHDDLRDALALTGASITGDTEGARVIRENADPAGLINALVWTFDRSLRLLAEQDGVTPERAVAKLKELLREAG